ncbi:MAG: hypothetical protein ACREJM_08490, partial [Candidatus Saccharimonadales bacterium]
MNLFGIYGILSALVALTGNAGRPSSGREIPEEEPPSFEEAVLEQRDEIFAYDVIERLNSRVIEDIRSWIAMHGALLAAELAAFAVLLDKLPDFGWWSVLAMAIAVALT